MQWSPHHQGSAWDPTATCPIDARRPLPLRRRGAASARRAGAHLRGPRCRRAPLLPAPVRKGDIPIEKLYVAIASAHRAGQPPAAACSRRDAEPARDFAIARAARARAGRSRCAGGPRSRSGRSGRKIGAAPPLVAVGPMTGAARRHDYMPLHGSLPSITCVVTCTLHT